MSVLKERVRQAQSENCRGRMEEEFSGFAKVEAAHWRVKEYLNKAAEMAGDVEPGGRTDGCANNDHDNENHTDNGRPD